MGKKKQDPSDYSNAYILVKGTVPVTKDGKDSIARTADRTD